MEATILFVVGATIGLVAGCLITSWNYQQTIIAPLRFEKAGLAAERVNVLSLLRIDDQAAAIERMEQMLDTETLVLTQNTNDPEQLPDDVVRTLTMIKAYRGLYPTNEQRAASISAALSKTPELVDYNTECSAGVCRLLKEKEKTNSAPRESDNKETAGIANLLGVQVLTLAEGQVLDPDGRPVQGVRVVCSAIHTRKSGEMPYVFSKSDTDSNGRYSFSVPSGKCYIRVGGLKCTYAKSESFHAEPNVKQRIENLIVRRASNSFQGTLLQSDGTPAAGIPYGYGSASFAPVRFIPGLENCLRTSSTGFFEAPHVLPDEPLAFWVIPKPDTAQIWKKIDTNLAIEKLTLQPNEYIDLLPEWDLYGEVRGLALQTVNVPDGIIEFEIPDLNGNVVSLSDAEFKDKVVIVNLTGSWCGGCQLETPELVKLKSKYEHEGLEVIGIAFEKGSTEQQLQAIEKNKDRHQINYTVLHGGDAAKKHVMSVIRGLKGFTGYPTTLFIGRDGKVADVIAGYPGITEERLQILAERLETKVVELLQLKP